MSAPTIVVEPDGSLRFVYTEQVDCAGLASEVGDGAPRIVRASHVEPDEQGRWWADMAPVGGPRLGPCALRSEALALEQRWLEEWLCGETR